MNNIPDILERLTRYERSSLAFTKHFTGLKHNNDLCPRLQEQVDLIMRAFGKYQSITYDTQGIRDDGGDIVLVYREESAEPSRIAFQLKSYDDLEAKGWMQSLKAQRDDAFRRISALHHYYIVTCTDQAVHKEKVRLIAAEFRDASRTFVLEPTYAWTFLTLQKYRIDAHVKRSFDVDDLVVKEAVNTVELPSHTAKSLAIHAVAQALFEGDGSISIETLRNSYAVEAIYEAVVAGIRQQLEAMDFTGMDEDEVYDAEELGRFISRDFDDLLAEDIEHLTDTLFDVDADDGSLRPHTKRLMPVLALLTDAMARFGLTSSEAVPYVSDLVGVPLLTGSSTWER